MQEQPLPPPGTLVEFGLESIEGGQFLAEINKHIRAAVGNIDAAGGGAVTITPTIRIARIKKSTTGVQIDAVCSVKTPKAARVEVVQAVQGRLLTDFRPPDDDRHQLAMFDRFGRPSGEALDTRTGEVVRPEPGEAKPVGKIG